MSKMNSIDKIVAYFNPKAGMQRAQARKVMGYYEAAKPSRKRKFHRDQAGPNMQTQQGAVAIRTQARHLDQNHDITRGAITTLVNNVIGPKGIGIEPQPRRADGTIHKEYAKALLEAYRDWKRKPEVTHQYRWSKAQRMLCRTWIRDGEAFAQQLAGPVAKLDHGTRVPYSLELFEPDMVPYHLNNLARGIRQGIELNEWGKPRAYWVYKAHPLDGNALPASNEVKRISAERVLHIKISDRIGQLRGVSALASVITRIEDIKDYEESERVAAKIAAMLTAYVKRGNPEHMDPDALPRDEEGNIRPREVGLEPGTIIDTLEVGEEIGMIDSKRPNPNLVTFRQGQLKAFAAGITASYSSIARDYNGTFSAQRQEMIEQWVHYATLTDEFVGDIIQPVWESFVRAAHISGVVPMPRNVVPESADDAMFVGQQMPWIDPAKEATAWLTLVRAGFASEYEVMRKRGVNPEDTIEQIQKFRDLSREKDLVFNSDAAWEQDSTAMKALQEELADIQEQERQAQEDERAANAKLRDLQMAAIERETQLAEDRRRWEEDMAQARALDDQKQRDARIKALEDQQRQELERREAAARHEQERLEAEEKRKDEAHKLRMKAQQSRIDAQERMEKLKRREAEARIESELKALALLEGDGDGE